MALVERLMGFNNDGTEDPKRRRGDNHIPVHLFYSGMLEVANGRLTPTQLRVMFAISSGVDESGRSDNQDLIALVALMPGPGTVARSVFIAGLHSCFILAEERMPGYETPAAVRLKLGI